MNNGVIIGEIEEIEEMEEISPTLAKMLRRAGLLLLLSGILITMGIITGEIFYPRSRGYTTGGNDISDLGATLPPEGFVSQPSAAIFNTAMLLGGLMVVLGAYYYYRASHDRLLGIPLFLLGLGAAGVGIFPGNIPVLHPFFSIITFVFGAVAAIVSFGVVKPPLRYIFIILGIISLFFLILNRAFIPILGIGGTERWIAYPIILWLVSFGAYILGRESDESFV